MYKLADLFTWENCLSAKLFDKYSEQEPWQILPEIKNYILELQKELSLDEYIRYSDEIFVHKTALIHPTAIIQGPCLIGPRVEIRPNSYIRTNAIIEADSLIGYTCELKNVIVLPKVQIAHFNYCGDSILGQGSHMACGAITSNVKGDKSLISARMGNDHKETGLRKFGALIADGVEIGCNAVLNPGTIVGKNSRIYPLSMVRGLVEENSIHKNTGEITKIRD